MARRLKELTVAELEDEFRDIHDTGCVLVGFHGMKADEGRAVRAQIRAVGGRIKVVRNRLFAVAMARLNGPDLAPLMDCSISVVRAANAVDAAKAVREAQRVCPALKVKGGYAEGRVLGPEAAERLADVPPREVLLGMVACALLAPLRQLVFGLTAKPRALASVLVQLRDRMGQQD
jgi:large subunit ribosomal protein L10